MTPTEQAVDRVKALVDRALEEHAQECRENPGNDQWDPICEVEPGDLLDLLSTLTALRARTEELEGARDAASAASSRMRAFGTKELHRANVAEFVCALMAVAAEPLEGLSAAEWKAEYLRRHEDVCQMMDRAIAAEARVGELEGALEFYADPISYAITQAKEPRSAVHGDAGRRARALLTPPLEQE